jgi:hypothetical protein
MAKKTSNSTINQNPKLSEFVIDGEATEICWKYISTLSKVVVSKYFAKYLEYFDKDDLVSLAISDAVEFIKKVASSRKDEDIKNMRNVLFTRIRNTLSNFVFRSNRLVSTADEILDRHIVNPKFDDVNSDLIDLHDLSIDSLESFREVSLRAWQLFNKNGANQKYTVTNDTDYIEDWEAYSEVRNMKSPCALISEFNNYTEDQIESLADKLDSVTGQNYFSTLYQLLGDKFLAFLDVFQEDKFNIPSTSLVKHILTDMSIFEDHSNGLSVSDLSNKYHKSESSIQKILASKEVI